MSCQRNGNYQAGNKNIEIIVDHTEQKTNKKSKK